jgi:general secretion pathway protein G
MMSSRSGVRGFSLIELLVVLAVIGILSMAVMPMVEVSVQRQREQELKRDLWEIRDAIDAYKRAVDAGLVEVAPGVSGYPPNLRVLVDGVPNLEQSGQTLFFLRRIPRDPFAADDVGEESSWGLRSYASDPENPRPGDDVYDIYSLSGKIGLNGVALGKW